MTKQAVILASEATASVLAKRLSLPTTIVESIDELVATGLASERSLLVFVESTELSALKKAGIKLANVIAVSEDPLHAAIRWLDLYPWLAHVISEAMLEHAAGAEYVRRLERTFAVKPREHVNAFLDKLETKTDKLTHAGSRAERLDVVTDYFTHGKLGKRLAQQLRDCAEELVTNAFYDAPVAAKLLKLPISRIQDLSFPEERAVLLTYGFTDEIAIVRVQDSFGSLPRRRVVEVLNRCARTDARVHIDESMGGAGLGLWRVFSSASVVIMSVVNNRHTDVIAMFARRAGQPRPYAFHLFFGSTEAP